MRFSKIALYNMVMLVLCLAAFYLNFKAYYPGFLSSDTFTQYEEALSGSYSTWHPPVMAYTWHLLNKISQGPQSMLAFQLALFWSAVYLFAISFKKKRWGVLLVMFFAWAPFIHNFSGWIVKDTLMAMSWLLAAAIMFKAATGPRCKMGWTAAIITGLLVVYGTWMRYNAVTALPPLCILWAWLAFRNNGRIVKTAMAAVLFFLTLLGNSPFNDLVLKARKEHTDFQIYFHDLAGIYVRTNKDYFPARVKVRPEFDTTFIRQRYTPINVTEVLWNEDGKRVIDPDAETTKALRSAWLNMIGKEPKEYLALRWEIFLHFLNLKKAEPSQYYFIWIAPNQYGFRLEGTRLYYRYVNKFSGAEGKFYFQSWFWILFNILLLPMVRFVKHRHMKLVFLCLAASGFLYTLPQFVIANTTRDFRYLYWACFACVLSVLVLLADRLFMKRVPATWSGEGREGD